MSHGTVDNAPNPTVAIAIVILLGRTPAVSDRRTGAERYGKTKRR
jgi:hypothetical protein